MPIQPNDGVKWRYFMVNLSLFCSPSLNGGTSVSQVFIRDEPRWKISNCEESQETVECIGVNGEGEIILFASHLGVPWNSQIVLQFARFY